MNIQQLAKAAGIRLYNGSAQSGNAWRNGFDRVLECDLERFAELIAEYERNACARCCLAEGEKHQHPMEAAHRLMAEDCAKAIHERSNV